MATYQAVAIDFDGTLTAGGPPRPDVMAAMAEGRRRGLRLILVTGRVLSELRPELPRYADLFDAVVAENGAVVMAGGRARALAPRVAPALEQALARRGVPVRAGQVLLASQAVHAAAALEEATRLGLEVELTMNRGEMMVLPAGVTKASGLRHALADLALSPHSTVAIGDGENDHSLMDVCELGIAVGNAIDALKAHADVVMHESAGDAVKALLEGPLLRGELIIEPRRWQLELGRTHAGAPVTMPGSGVNVLISGSSGSGKSYLLGLLVERLVDHDYSVCLFDPEGDHASLAGLRDVVALGSVAGPPTPEALGQILEHPDLSAVVDLSSLEEAGKRSWMRRTFVLLSEQRRRTGLPHWLLIDEAHLVASEPGCGFDPEQSGICLVSYVPERCGSALREADLHLTLGSPAGRARLSRWHGRGPVDFTMAERARTHVRHWHKYVSAALPRQYQFVLRAHGAPTGRIAGNVRELHRELERCDGEVILHHAGNRDFSRWTHEVLKDDALAEAFGRVEDGVRRGSLATAVARRQLMDAIEHRYLAGAHP